MLIPVWTFSLFIFIVCAIFHRALSFGTWVGVVASFVVITIITAVWENKE